MTPEKLRLILAACAIAVTAGFLAFVGIKSFNDGRIAVSTAEIAGILRAGLLGTRP